MIDPLGMRCVHEWERVDGTRHVCKKCKAIGYRRHWAGVNKTVLRYFCACGRIATKAIWRGTHEAFVCNEKACQKKGDRARPAKTAKAA